MSSGAKADTEIYRKAIRTILTPGTITFQFDKHFRFASPLVKKGTQLIVPAEKILGKKIERILPSHLVKSIKASVSELIRTKKPQDFDYHLTEKGKERVFSVHLIPILNPETALVEYIATIIDVTARTEAEIGVQALRKSEAMYRALTESSKDMIFVLDPEGRVRFFNKFAATAIGVKLKDAIGHRVSEFFPKDIAERQAKNVREVFRTGKAIHIPTELLVPEEGMYIDTVLSPIKDPSGRTVLVMGIARDVSERIRNETKLKESEERYSTIIRSSSDAIYTMTKDGILTSASPVVKQLLGWKPKELIGKNISSVIHPFDLPTAFLFVRKVLKGEAPPVHEIRFRHKRGGYVVGAVSSSPLVKDGKTIGLTGAVRDVTERKKAEEVLRESEEKYRTLVEESPDAIMILDRSRRLVFSNKPADVLTGRHSDDTGKDITRLGLLNKKDTAAVIRNMARIFSGKEIPQFEIGIIRPDRTTAQVEVNATPTSYLGGSVFVRMHDLTERKKAEEKIVFLNKLLQTISEANQMMVKETDRDLLLSNICRIIVDHGGFKMAWVGMADFRTKEVRPVASAGFSKPYLKNIKVRCDDSPLGRGPTGMAIRTGKIHVVADTGKNRGFAPWAGKAKIAEFRSSAAVPITMNGRTVGALNVYSEAPDTFKSDILKMISELAGDMSYALEAMDERDKRRVLEEEIRKEEEEFEKIFDASPNMIIYKSKDDRIINANRAFLDFHGIRKKEALGKKTAYVITPRGLAKKVRLDDLNVIKTRKPSPDTVRHFISPFSRKELWGIVSKQPFYSAKGDIIGTVTFIADITERKQAEETLRESENRYRSLFTNMLNGFAYCKVVFKNGKPDDFVYLDVNENFGKLTGLKDVVGKSVTEVIPGIKRSNPELIQTYGKVSLTGKPERFESFSETFGGWLDVSVYSPMKGYFVAVFDNVTDRKRAEENIRQSEERYRTIVDNAKIAIVINDKHGKYRFANNMANEWIGENLVGKNIRDFFPKRFADERMDAILKTMRTEKTTVVDEYHSLKNKDQWFSASMQPLRNKEGKIDTVMAIVQDVTDSKRIKDMTNDYAMRLESEVNSRTAQLEDAKRRVELLSDTKDEFIRSVTHELKTPLSVILGNLTLLKEYGAVGKEKEWMKLLSMLERNSIRLRNDIEQILQLSRLEKVSLRGERVYLREVLNDTYHEHLPLAKSKGIDLKMSTEQIVLMGDRDLLKLAVNNLVSNAIKFTEHGSVTISTRATEDTATIEISDTGMGISPENRKHIFSRFFKANPNAPGTGIGLSITAQIVEKHGGRIQYDSELGKGSTFRIILPLKAAADEGKGPK
ncbi:Methanogenesis regulatory histidine kinase FilI [uncultured archaeon]|nr:Methanogenesis regulatory histidine kinase FilI [uncultured archaeon]